MDNLKVDRTVKSVNWIRPGENSAFKRLSYLKSNMNNYSLDRNNPTLDKLSNLSPYFHFGHIAPQRVAWEINNSNLNKEDKEASPRPHMQNGTQANPRTSYTSSHTYVSLQRQEEGRPLRNRVPFPKFLGHLTILGHGIPRPH